MAAGYTTVGKPDHAESLKTGVSSDGVVLQVPVDPAGVRIPGSLLYSTQMYHTEAH